jgi:hypothetical protein
MSLVSEGYDPGNISTSPDLTIIYELRQDSKNIKADFSKRNASSYFMSVDGKALPYYLSSSKIELVRSWVERIVNETSQKK